MLNAVLVAPMAFANAELIMKETQKISPKDVDLNQKLVAQTMIVDLILIVMAKFANPLVLRIPTVGHLKSVLEANA